MAVEAGLSVYVVGGQGVRLFVVVVSCGVLDVFLLKLMVSSGITKDGLSKSKVDSCGVCSLRVKANSVLCIQCGK